MNRATAGTGLKDICEAKSETFHNKQKITAKRQQSGSSGGAIAADRSFGRSGAQRCAREQGSSARERLPASQGAQAAVSARRRRSHSLALRGMGHWSCDGMHDLIGPWRYMSNTDSISRWAAALL